MKIELTHQESETMFHNALCNGLDYVSDYGLELKIKKNEYEAAKQRLKEQSPDTIVCYEDILLEILKGGGTLEMLDLECDSYNSVIRIEDVYSRVSQTPLDHLLDMIKEQDDAVTADVIIQTVFYNEVIFG
jgi:hypothetical protein